RRPLPLHAVRRVAVRVLRRRVLLVPEGVRRAAARGAGEAPLLGDGARHAPDVRADVHPRLRRDAEAHRRLLAGVRLGDAEHDRDDRRRGHRAVNPVLRGQRGPVAGRWASGGTGPLGRPYARMARGRRGRAARRRPRRAGSPRGQREHPAAGVRADGGGGGRGRGDVGRRDGRLVRAGRGGAAAGGGPAVTVALLLAELAALGAAYGLGVRHVRRWPAWRTGCFGGGLVALVVALVTMDGLADASLTGHMVQHLVLVFVAAPLIVLGSPVALALRATRRAARRVTGARALAH